jgi:four helix bundle protein
LKITNAEFNERFNERIRIYVIRAIKFVEALPFNTVTKVMGEQFLKATTSTGANHRAFCRGRSLNEKFSKICIVVEEIDEAVYWTDMFNESKYGDKEELKWLFQEGSEILLIASATKNGIYSAKTGS